MNMAVRLGLERAGDTCNAAQVPTQLGPELKDQMNRWETGINPVKNPSML